MRYLGLVVGMMLIGGILSACGGNALYAETFDDLDTLPDALRTDNLTVGVQNGVVFLSVAETGRGQAGYLFFNADVLPEGDYTVEAKLRLGSGQVGLWVRGDEAGCEGYGLIVDSTLDTYRLSVGNETCGVQALDTQTRLDVDINQDYTLRIEARGEMIRGFVDGVEFFDVTDTTFASGIPFLRLLTDGTVVARIELDEVVIR